MYLATYNSPNSRPGAWVANARIQSPKRPQNHPPLGLAVQGFENQGEGFCLKTVQQFVQDNCETHCLSQLILGSVYRLSHGTTISFSSQSRTEARVVEGFDIAPCPHRGWLDGYPGKSKGWERQELNRAKPYLSTLPIEEGTNALGYMHVHEPSSLDDSYCPLSPLG